MKDGHFLDFCIFTGSRVLLKLVANLLFSPLTFLDHLASGTAIVCEV